MPDIVTIIGLVVVAGLLLWANGGSALAWLRTLWPSSVTPGPDDGDDLPDSAAVERLTLAKLIVAREDLLEIGEVEAAKHVADAIASLLAVEVAE